MSDQPTPTPQPPTPPPTFRTSALALLRGLWRRVENVVFGLVIFFILLYFVLQMSAVQNWLIGKVTAYLSEDLGTVVRVEHVGFEFFDNLVLEGLYVQDLKGDTLLYAEKFSAGLNSNVFSIFQNKLEFNEISLRHARFNIRRAEGEADNNLKFLIDYFGGSKPKKPSSRPARFQVRIQNFNLKDVVFLQDDAVRGKTMRFEVPKGNVRVNNFDLAAKIVDIRSVSLDGFAFTLLDVDAKPLPTDGQEQPAADPPSDPPAQQPNTPSTPLRFFIGRFALTNGRFDLDNFSRAPLLSDQAGVMDYDHMKVSSIDIQADSIRFTNNLDFTGRLRNLSAKEKGGFELTRSSADHVVVCDTLTALYGVTIQTPGSTLGDTVMFHYDTYRAYNHFNNEVRMDIRLKPGSKLRLGDISNFSAPVARNTFFVNNANRTADLSGWVEGRVNKLNGRNLRIRVGEKAFMEGSFDGDDMARGNDVMRLRFDFDRLQSDFQTIQSIMPGFKPPESFSRLGNIGFSGTYQLLFSTFHILKGDLLTDLGKGDVDMQLDLSQGRERATYGGIMNLRGFDLGTWTGNKDLGKTTFRLHIDEKSTGLTLPTIRAKVDGTVDTFVYRDYTYRNVVANGLFREKTFDGTLGVKDPNIDFFFDGKIDMSDSVPSFLFSAQVNRLDLGALNLVNEDWVVSCSVDRIKLDAREWRDITGQAKIRNFLLIQDNDTYHRLDSITFASNYAPSGSRYFGITTDVANAYVEGQFDMRTAGRHLQQLLVRQHPTFGRQLGIAPNDSLRINDRYRVSIFVKNSKAFTRLLSPDLGPLRNVRLEAEVDAPQGRTSLNLQVPRLDYRKDFLDSVQFMWNSVGARATYALSIDTTLAGGQRIREINLAGLFDADNLDFRLTTRDTSTLVKGLSLGGRLSVLDSLWQVQFSSSEIILFDRYWAIEDGNYLRFNQNHFETRDFEFFSGNQRIRLDTFNEFRGLFLSLANFDMAFVNEIVGKKSFDLSGEIQSFDITLDDLYRLQNIKIYIETKEVRINGTSYGALSGNVEMAHLAAPLWWNFKVRYSNQRSNDRSPLRLTGTWLPKGDSAVYVADVDMTVKPGEFQTRAEATNFPLQVLQTFIPGISGTEGRLAADVTLGGPFNRVKMKGYADIQQGKFQIDYLKTPFHIRNQRISLTEYRIWADGDTIWDVSENRHMALIHGGLIHNHFRDWRLSCEIESQSDKFVILNTLPNDNELFYGKGAGKFKAAFTGTFVRTNIDITATTGDETRLFIPVSSTADAKEVGFINFVDKSKKDTLTTPTKRVAESELKGVNFDLNLSITDKAEVQLIFDEQAGDIIKGRGTGDVQIVVNRQGEFKMFGNYFIDRGEYLFTLLNFVNKPFVVKPGGSIAWYGDPYGAQINLDATYTENTPVYNFLSDELQLLEAADESLADLARKTTRVVVTMHLKGDLMKPTISFDLDFPNLPSQLKNLADNKLRQLRQDPNELNRQVFGLVVVGSFLPGNSDLTYLTSSAFNTLTQVFTNQLSNYLTGLAAEWFGSTVSSIDFDIAYNDYQSSLTSPGGSTGVAQAGRELQVRLTSGFVNDRITIQFGSQFGLSRPGTNVQDGFLGEDITVEIQLTDNRQWRLKMYQRTEPDVGGGQRRARFGLGISFHRDYDSFDEMMRSLGETLRKRRGG